MSAQALPITTEHAPSYSTFTANPSDNATT